MATRADLKTVAKAIDAVIARLDALEEAGGGAPAPAAVEGGAPALSGVEARLAALEKADLPRNYVVRCDRRMAAIEARLKKAGF